MENVPTSLPELFKLSRTLGNLQKSKFLGFKILRTNRGQILTILINPVNGPHYAQTLILVNYTREIRFLQNTKMVITRPPELGFRPE